MTNIIEDLEIIGIRDPNTERERVLLRAINTTTLEWYLFINTKRTEINKIRRLNDHIFWFPSNIEVKAGEFIRVYTARKGKYRRTNGKYGERKVIFHDFLWGLENPIWGTEDSNAVTLFNTIEWNTESSK